MYLFIGSIYTSNFIAAFISFNFGYSFQDNNFENIDNIIANTPLNILWGLNLPQIISNKTA